MRKNSYTSDALILYRSDTIHYNTDTTFQKIKASYHIVNGNSTSDAVLESFLYSDFINPLSRLNISGLHYSWITAPNDLEILGNSDYKTISNTNILPRYCDFASSLIPTKFFNNAYNSVGGFLYGDEFHISINPSSVKNNYPGSITVTGSSSYPGDAFIYNYFY